MAKMIDLSIVIVNWNTKEMVAECLGSLKRYAAEPAVEIIVVDNASLDGSPDLVREQFAHVRLVQNEKNLGFAKANNIGMNLSTGKYVCLINSDVKVPEDCLENIIRYMEQHPTIGMLGPKMILPDGRVGQSCLRFPTVWNWLGRALAWRSLFKGSRLFGTFEMTDFRYDRVMDVDALTGWFWVVRREALNQVGLLDERFFMYGEDIDWPKRFHQSGWRVVFYPDAEATHLCAASSSKDPTRFYVEMTRASMQYFRKHHNSFAVAGFWLTSWLHEVVRVVCYGLIYLLRRPGRSEARFKVKRSMACLFWLMGLREALPGRVK